jgi:hypothetical protein
MFSFAEHSMNPQSKVSETNLTSLSETCLEDSKSDLFPTNIAIM